MTKHFQCVGGSAGAATKNRQEGEGKDDEEKTKMRGMSAIHRDIIVAQSGIPKIMIKECFWKSCGFRIDKMGRKKK